MNFYPVFVSTDNFSFLSWHMPHPLHWSDTEDNIGIIPMIIFPLSTTGSFHFKPSEFSFYLSQIIFSLYSLLSGFPSHSDSSPSSVLAVPATSTALFRVELLPMPSSPYPLEPQHLIPSPEAIAQVCVFPPAMAMAEKSEPDRRLERKWAGGSGG